MNLQKQVTMEGINLFPFITTHATLCPLLLEPLPLHLQTSSWRFLATW